LCNAGFAPEWIEDLDLVSFWALIEMQIQHEARNEIRDFYRFRVAMNGDEQAVKKWQKPLQRALEGAEYNPADDPDTGQNAFLQRFGGGF